MDVKKFQAPSLKEALDQVKDNLGPEAVILQTRNVKRTWFKAARVEVMAAASGRALNRKKATEARIRSPEVYKGLSAKRQADVIDKYTDKASQMSSSKNRASSPLPQQVAGQMMGDLDGLLKSSDRIAERVQFSGAQPTRSQTNEYPGKASSSGHPVRYIDIVDPVDGYSDGHPDKHAYEHSGADIGLDSFDHEGRLSADRVQAHGGSSRADGSLSQLDARFLEMEEKVQKLAALQDQIRGMVRCSFESPKLDEVFETLVLAGLDRRYALSLLQVLKFDFGDQPQVSVEKLLEVVAAEMIETFPIGSLVASRDLASGADSEPGRLTKGKTQIMGLLGPSGSGKTSMAAKIAAGFGKEYSATVGFVYVNAGANAELNGFEHLATFARILNLPFRSCASHQDLRGALDDFSCLDFVIIDGPGSCADPSYQEKLGVIVAGVNIQWYWVLPASMREIEVLDYVQRSQFRGQGVFFTKLDETKIYGFIYNICKKLRLPAIGFSTGRRVPDQLEQATAERVVSLIMKYSFI
jgi:flagellar biosynthesis protein FlhF